MPHWQIINGVKERVDAMKGVADVLQNNWTNLSGEAQEAIEDILNDCEAWATTAGSYPGANDKVDQMCHELEQFLPPED